MHVITWQGGVFQYKPLKTSICSLHRCSRLQRSGFPVSKLFGLLFLVSCHAIQNGDPLEPIDVGSTEKQWGIAEPDNYTQAGMLS